MEDQKVLAERPINSVDNKTLLNLITNGDASSLTGEQKLAYYKARCDAAGLDYRTQPFQFIRMSGKEVLYALKSATDQLANIHGARLEIIKQETENDMRVVTVRAITKDGRQTDEIGVVPLIGIKGADLANAYMKAVTKAKRRAILSVCGLGMIDETELDTVKDAVKVQDGAPVHPQVVDNGAPLLIPDQAQTEKPAKINPDELRAEFVPGNVDVKTTSNGNKYFIIHNGMNRYRTFDTTDGDVAQRAFAEKRKITVEYHPGKFGNEISFLCLAESDSAVEPDPVIPF